MADLDIDNEMFEKIVSAWKAEEGLSSSSINEAQKESLAPDIARSLEILSFKNNVVLIDNQAARGLDKARQIADHISNKKIFIKSGFDRPTDNNLLGELLGRQDIALIGITDFRGYRKLERDMRTAARMNFVITHPDISEEESDKRIAVIGATSFLGNKVFHILRKECHNVIGTGFSKTGFINLNIKDENAVKNFFFRNKARECDVVPQSVF